MVSPALIALTGPAGSGKDLVAALLGMRGYQRLAFADALRDEVERFVSCAPGYEPPGSLSEDIKRRLFLGHFNPVDIRRKPTSPLVRRLLQEWGMWRRRQDPNYWIDKLHAQYCGSGAVRAVITDMRFQNEAEYVKSRGGRIWRVHRPESAIPNPLSPEAADHVSETELNGFEADQVIYNTGSLWDLQRRVKEALYS